MFSGLQNAQFPSDVQKQITRLMQYIPVSDYSMWYSYITGVICYWLYSSLITEQKNDDDGDDDNLFDAW